MAEKINWNRVETKLIERAQHFASNVRDREDGGALSPLVDGAVSVALAELAVIIRQSKLEVK